MTKACCRCGAEKPILSFVKSSRSKSGFSNRCKACHAAISRASVEANLENRKNTCAKYYQNNKDACSLAARSWAKNNPEKVAQSRKKHRENWTPTQRSRDRASKLRHQKIIRERYPDRYRARTLVNNMVASGKLPNAKSLECSHCGGPACEYHHYKGYEKENWTEVTPLCKPCHKAADASREVFDQGA